MSDAPIGIIGLGLMGSAMAARLNAAGFPVLGHDVDPARAAVFGMTYRASVAMLAAETRLLLLAVYDEAQARDVLHQLDGPHTVACITTCTPEGATMLAVRAAARGVTLLEFPISGTSAQLMGGEAVGLLAGDAAAAEAALPVLHALCPRITRFGRVGDAARAKLAINLVLQVNRAALAEGMALAERLGLDALDFLDAARASAAYSQVMDTKGVRMAGADYTPQSRIAQTLKDAEMIQATAGAAGLALPLHAAQAELLRGTIALLGPDVDPAAVIAPLRAGRTA